MGADDYIAKPFSPRELSARIANLLEQRRLLRERYRREITLEPGISPLRRQMRSSSPALCEAWRSI